MASTYALPASAMTHSHGHGHIHSHSHSPSRPYTSRTLKPERSNGSLHSHSQSDAHLDQSHSHSHSHSHSSHSHAHSHSHSHSREREPSSSSYLPTPPDSTGLPPIEKFEKQLYERSPALSALGSYERPVNDVNVVPHDHSHHLHPHTPQLEPRSRFTNLILPIVLRWPLLHTIMAEKDSRRIFYFMSLNFAFMVVQACYGFLTDSLGLLSDSIHMFFDCLALGVGLFAAIASKWPPSERFPYGFGKIESLSGFGNGVFLMLISIEIMIEATERLAEGRETKRLGELFVVSALGLAVNLVGMACFGHHGHAGHDHGGHSHDHSHSHTDEKAHAHDCHDHHDHDHKHDHDHEHDHGHSHHDSLMSQSPSKKAASKASHAGHSHSHSHDNENMHGIFLHVLADTMGSAAVMVSTALIYFVGWNGWDPLASCVIAILIFLSSIPLIKSCAKKLLLTVPDEIEYTLRDALGGLSDLRGVASYSVPRFWMGDKNTDSESEQVLGVIHIVATRGSDLDDVRERARDLLLVHGIDAVLQVEASGDMSCWCGSSASRSPSTSASGF